MEKEIEKAKEALENAETELCEHLVGYIVLKNKTDFDQEATANLCEAYLDEWNTYRQLAKGQGEVNEPTSKNPS
jgi:hypothetical protein